MNAPTNTAADHTLTCGCGNPKPHRLAARETSDGKRVELWSTGAVTGGMGFALDGVPIARPRSAEARTVALRAGWLLIGEVELWDRAEVPALYAACRRVAARGGEPGDVRAAMAAKAPHIPIRWEVLQADRDGETTCRVGTLPRLMWAGVGVWHESGRYEIMHEHADGHGGHAWHGTGITFASQRELFRYLAANPTRTTESA